MVSLRLRLRRLRSSRHARDRGTTEESSPNPQPDYPPLQLHSALSQLDSPLSNLPPEIRCLIWTEILGGYTIHLEVTEEEEALRGIECIGRNCLKTICVWGCHPKHYIPMLGAPYMLPLLLICKLVYIEAVHCLYTSNTFVIRNLESMRYVDNTRSIPPFLPQHFNSIRSLRFMAFEACPAQQREAQPSVVGWVDRDFREDWKVVWRTLADMRGLRILHVDLQPCNYPYRSTWADTLEVALEPVEKKTRRGERGTFSLHLPIDGALWWKSIFARSALDAMDGIYRIDGHDGPYVELPEWAK